MVAVGEGALPESTLAVENNVRGERVMETLGLYLAAAASGCCAYLAGLAIERWVTWPTLHGRAWGLVIMGAITGVNVALVHVVSRLGMPIPWGALYVILQVHFFLLILIGYIVSWQSLISDSTLFIGFNIGALTVQLVGVRLAFVSSEMHEATSFLWSGGSFLLLSALAIRGLRQGILQRADRDGGLTDHV